jgi:transposase
MKPTTIAVDLAKSVFEIAVSDRPGRIRERHRLSRARFVRFFAQRPPALVLLEACGSAHHWARELTILGHRVVLLPPHLTVPYVARDKTDRSDAKALLEAFRNEDIHPVPIKTVGQQALASLHRLRSTWLTTRTARLNTLRGLLREFGLFIPVGAHHVLPQLASLLEDPDSPLPHGLRPALAEAAREIRELELRMRSLERDLHRLAAEDPTVMHLYSIPGIGWLSATALVAFVGDMHRFPSGRHFASYLGLTARVHASGSRRSLGAISKRGDVYLRMLLIHGARALLNSPPKSGAPDALRAWALRIQQRRGHNRATVALANKLARIVWAVWRHNTDFHQPHPA